MSKIKKSQIKVKPKEMTLCNSKSHVENTGYENDFYLWTVKQSNLLKRKDFRHLDLVNIIEEIESLGNENKRSLKSHLVNLLLHKLKEMFQPSKKTKSWSDSITHAERQIYILIEYSPSLKKELVKVFEKSYQDARKDALKETQLDEKIIPKDCPWTLSDLFPELKIKKK